MNNGPSIAIVSYYFTPLYGGMQTQLLLLSRYLVSQGFTVTVFTAAPHGCPLNEDIKGIKICRFGSAHSLDGIQLAYKNIISELQLTSKYYDILYMPLGIGSKYPLQPQFDVMRVFLSKSKPVVLRITSSGRVSELMERSPSTSVMLRQATAIVSLNEKIEQELLMAGVAHESIFRVPNGVDIEMFTPFQRSGQSIHNQDRAPTFIYPCRICDKKNIHTLIDDWNVVRDTTPRMKHATLTIIGDDNRGTEDSSLLQKVTQITCKGDSGVTILPSVPHHKMPDIYRNSGIFINCSFQEGMSNAALEAMACGLPIIVPNTPAFAPLIMNDLNFSYNCTKDLRKAIRTAVRFQSRWHNIGFINRELVESQFSATKILERYASRFTSIIDQKHCHTLSTDIQVE